MPTNSITVFCVFGDPRRADRSTIYTATVPSETVEVDVDHATLMLGDFGIPGPVLSYEPDGVSPHLSIAVSDVEPRRDLADRFTTEGWITCLKAPRSVTAPFVVDATLLYTGETPDQARLFHGALWFDKQYMPTQRFTTWTPGGPDIPVRVLAWADPETPGGHPVVLLQADPNYTDTVPDFVPGWVPMPGYPIPTGMFELARIAAAVEVTCGYLLSAPIVLEATIHDRHLMQFSDFETLPEEVSEEVYATMLEAGYDLAGEPQ